jgi:hypothetical protein
VGTTSPYSTLAVSGNITLQKNASNVIQSYTGAAYTNLSYDAAVHIWGTSGTERARITSGGELLVGTTSNIVNANAKLQVVGTEGIRGQATSSGGTASIGAFATSTGGTYYYIGYDLTASAIKFQVLFNGDVENTNNSYGAISDEKVKQDIVDAASQWNDVKALRVRKFRFKADPTAPLQIGLVAQEAEIVSPGIVSEHPDYEEVEITDEEGNVKTERQPTGTVTKSVKYSVLYMKAIKALQEAMTRIEQLEAKVAALEAK